MGPRFLRGASFVGYGATMFVGVGVPIPVLDEEMAYFTSRSDEDLVAPVVDYGNDYPNRVPANLGEVSYARLKSGSIVVNGKEISAFPISSYSKAKEIAIILKDWIDSGRFFLTQPVEPLPGPGEGSETQFLEERPA